MTVFPTLEDVLSTHARLIERFGGAVGLRDRGALEAPLARPRSGYYRDIIEQAAALLESLWQNHPFLDGNKRTAITVTAAVLLVNGSLVEFDDDEAYQFLMRLAEAGDFRLSRLDTWLRSHTRRHRD